MKVNKSTSTPLQNKSRPDVDARGTVMELLDPGSFVELDAIAEHDCSYFGAGNRTVPGDGLITGYGAIDGRPVLLYAHDPTFLGGSSGRMHALKIVKILDLALRVGIPIIALNNSSGIRIHEGVDAGVHFGEVFYKTVKASGIVPQISLILGDCVGGAAYTPALTDFVIMSETDSTMFLTGPTVIRTATGEEVTKEQIGGGRVHAEVTGLAHFLVTSRAEALSLTRGLLSYLPQNNCSPVPLLATGDTRQRNTPRIATIIPVDANQPFNILEVIEEIVDDGEFLEVQSLYANNIIVGFARIGGHATGIVASQPAQLAGCLNIAASQKAARFVRTCDAFGIPILTLLDVPGYLPGIQQETGGIIGAGAKLLHAYCEASVPKLAIILRKAHGGAYPTLANRSATDFCFALPNAEIAVMGPESAVDVIFRREVGEAENPRTRREELVREYREAHASAVYSAKKAYIDGLVAPEDVRNIIISTFQLLRDKISSLPGRRHSNIQL